MKTISASLALLALIATEPAFAGCGSHGLYRSRPAKATIVVNRIVKREATSNVRTATAVTAAKLEPTSQVSASNTGTTESSAAKTVQSAAAVECKEYSATIGGMITVPCS
jgi:hypothetical protein